MTSPLDIAKETLEQRKQFAESLRILLEESKNINMDKLLVTKVENLKYSSYVGAVSFKQFASVGRFAHTLDWFTDKIINLKSMKNFFKKLSFLAYLCCIIIQFNSLPKTS